MDRNFALPPIGKPTLVFALLLGVGVPLAMAVGAYLLVSSGEIEPLAALMVHALVAIVLLAALLPLWRRQVAFDGKRIRVRATYYTREATLAELRLAEAQVVDLHGHKELRPLLKTNGVALPGFLAGHFRLRDWRRKAFCLVTDRSKVLVLPHADGSLWLLSFEHPQAVLDILRRAAG